MSCHSTHVGIAATAHARAVTDLDDAQIASIFHRLKKDHANASAPDVAEAEAVLRRMSRDVAVDPDLDERTRNRIAQRYERAIGDVRRGIIPDGRTWAAMRATLPEAQAAQASLDSVVADAARQQRTSPDRMAAKFRRWRRDPDSYEDIESPDSAFRPDPEAFPADRRTQRALRKLGFENHLAQRLPVFVYGTLREHQHNSHLMNAGLQSRAPGRIDGVNIYGPGWGFPYALESPDGSGRTVGELVTLSDDADGDWSRERLDHLEGFDSDAYSDSHYRRLTRDVTITSTDGTETTVKAWVYLAGLYGAERCTRDQLVSDGDWVAAKEAKEAHRSVAAVPRYRVTKRAVDPIEPASTPTASRSARDAAAAFGLLDDLDDDAYAEATEHHWLTEGR